MCFLFKKKDDFDGAQMYKILWIQCMDFFLDEPEHWSFEGKPSSYTTQPAITTIQTPKGGV